MEKHAIPCIISLLMATLYNIMNQAFIANAGYLASYGNDTNTMAFRGMDVGFLVQLADGSWRYLVAPQGFCDILHTPDGYSSRYISIRASPCGSPDGDTTQ